jgi:hypothetical protein
MPAPHQVEQWIKQRERDKKARDWDRMREYNILLENYLCECISLFTQLGITPPEMEPGLERVLDEKFLSALNGE